MRKTKYFIILAAALSLASCTDKEPLKNLPEGMATLRMGFVSELPGTRSFGPTASISELHVIVFDESGCYSESAEAENLTPGQGADGRETKFDVTLTATSNPVTLHFIAGADPGNIPFGVESEILGAITTSGGGDAYWQRIDLADGIPSDGTTPATLKRIPLVRNFAAISVTSTATGFTFSGYALTNIPDRGSVAPHTASGGFAPFTGRPVRPIHHSTHPDITDGLPQGRYLQTPTERRYHLRQELRTHTNTRIRGTRIHIPAS